MKQNLMVSLAFPPVTCLGGLLKPKSLCVASKLIGDVLQDKILLKIQHIWLPKAIAIPLHAINLCMQ